MDWYIIHHKILILELFMLVQLIQNSLYKIKIVASRCAASLSTSGLNFRCASSCWFSFFSGVGILFRYNSWFLYTYIHNTMSTYSCKNSRCWCSCFWDFYSCASSFSWPREVSLKIDVKRGFIYKYTVTFIIQQIWLDPFFNPFVAGGIFLLLFLAG